MPEGVRRSSAKKKNFVAIRESFLRLPCIPPQPPATPTRYPVTAHLQHKMNVTVDFVGLLKWRF